MVAPSGFSTGTTNFSSTVRTAIAKKVLDTLRAGLIALPRGAVVPANVLAKVGDNWTLRATAYPDLADAVAVVGAGPVGLIMRADPQGNRGGGQNPSRDSNGAVSSPPPGMAVEAGGLNKS